jgi:predicted Zn-dependent peptidase
MLATGKSFLVFDRVDSLEAIRNQLDGITSAQLRETANQVLDPVNLNLLIFE